MMEAGLLEETERLRAEGLKEGDTLTVSGLPAGETVEIQVRQLDGTGEYTLTVE